MIIRKLKENAFYLLAIFVFWLLMLASRASLLRVFPSGGDVGDIAVSIVWVLLIAASFVLALTLGDSLPKNFLRIALLIGIFYTVITVFSFCTDEEYHFQRAFSVTNGDFMPAFLNGQSGEYLPVGYSVFSDTDAWSLANFAQNSDLVSPVRALFFFQRTRSASYLPLSYLPGAAGLGLGRLLGLPLVVDLVLGRLTNYLAYTFVCWLAIRRTRHFQSVLFLTALIPTALELAGTFTPDSTLISFTLLFVSIFLHYTFDDTDGRIERRDLILLFISAVFLLSVKYLGYFAVTLLVFFLPKRRVRNKKTAVIVTLGAILIVAAAQLWALAVYPDSLDDTLKAGIGMGEQLRYILQHTSAFIRTLAIDFMPNFVRRLYDFIDTGEMSLNFIAEPLFLLPIVGALLSKDKPALTIKQKLGWSSLWLALFTVTVLFSITALYLCFTPIGATSVKGMQNRYVLPVVILVYLVISLVSVENKIVRWERVISLLAGIAVVNILGGKLIEWMMI